MKTPKGHRRVERGEFVAWVVFGPGHVRRGSHVLQNIGHAEKTRKFF